MRAVLIVTLLLPLAGCLAGPDAELASQALPTVSGADREVPYNGTLIGFGQPTLWELDGNGQGIWVYNDTLYWTNGGDLWIADVSDPEQITVLGSLDDVGARDVDVLEWQGSTYALLAGSGRGMHVVDVTDRSAPALVTTVQMPSAGVHNLAAVPGTPYIYSSGASGQEKRIDVLDITEPASPLLHTFPIPATMGGVPVESDGCHDISVRADLGRAYCAGGGGTYAGAGGESFIWDIGEDGAEALSPTWITMIDDPRIKYHHQALANTDGTILVLDDEHIIADNCVRHDTPLPGSLDPQVPTGAAWIWDISDESDPVLKAIVQNPETTSGETGRPNVNCGSHFGDMILGQEAFVMGWYSGGTMLVSFEDSENPKILDILPANGSVWDAQYFDGRIYHSANDLVVTPLV